MRNPPDSAATALRGEMLEQLEQAGALLADLGDSAHASNLVAAWAEQVAAALAASRLDDQLAAWQQARLRYRDPISVSHSVDRLAALCELLAHLRASLPSQPPQT